MEFSSSVTQSLDKDAEENERTELTLSVDTILLRSSVQSGVFLYRGGNMEHLIVIYSLESLEPGEDYYTENKNRVIRVAEDEVSLISPGGEVVSVPIPKPATTEEPVLLDRRASIDDPSISNSAEAVLEDLTGKRLYSGIPLTKDGEDWGRIIFSLKELPIGITFVNDQGHRICRENDHSFNIDRKEYQPAKATHLLSGQPVVQQQGGSNGGTSRTMVETDGTVNISEFGEAIKEVPKAPLSAVHITPEERKYKEWKESLAVETYDKRLEKAKTQRRDECNRKVQSAMNRYQHHYSQNDMAGVQPLLNDIESSTGSNAIMEQDFVKQLKAGISATKKYEGSLKVKLQMEEYKQKYTQKVAAQTKKLRLELPPMNKLEKELNDILDSPRPSLQRQLHHSPKQQHIPKITVEPIDLYYENPQGCYTIE